uniref:ADF-H domain-containing protein n=1 Tax=Ditylenchus dipsaci TaxID=166011 RepID=A0A915DG56_9BILA
MSSGVMVHDDCQSAFKKISGGRHSLRYIIYKIQDKEIVVETAVAPEDIGGSKDDYDDNSKIAYSAFVKDLKERTNGFKDCRYAVFDFKFTTHRPGAGISKMDKIIFIQLCPDAAPIKNRMVYASSASAIKSSLGSEKVIQLQVSDESEIVYADVLSKLTDKYRDN